MPTSPVALVRLLYDAFGRGDMEALRRSAHPDVVLDLSRIYPGGPVLRGIADVLRFEQRLPWKAGSVRFEPQGFVEARGERVLVPVVVRAVGEGSAIGVEHRAAHLVTVRDGRIARIESFGDEDAARAALADVDRPTE